MADPTPSRSEPPAPAAATDERLALYKVLVDTVRDYAIFALDPTGHVLTWNAGARQIKGYEASEIVGRHFSVFYPPEDVARGKPDDELVIAARVGRVEDEGWRVRKDGTRFWASVVITALRDPAGALIGFGKVTRDLSERRAAEEALRASEARFRLLVHNVRDYGVFMLDREGRISSWNGGAQRITGSGGAEAIGRHVSIFYPPEDVRAGKPQRQLEIAEAEGRYEEEGWRVRSDGTRFWAHVVVTAVRDDDGRLLGFAKVTRDLTERIAAEQRALADERRIAAAEAANAAKAQFLATMSHELRTPLNAIGGYAELLELGLGGPVTDEQRDYLDRIRRSKQHLLGIINDLLNYTRIEAGQVGYDIEPVPLTAVAGAVLPMVEPQAAARGIAVVQAPCPREVVARADRAKVEQILLNLMSNAVKFTEPGGRVTVTCAAREGVAVLEVRDTGIGIPREKLEAIFEPFVQLGRALTTSHEGTGLGLAISRDLARAMGGELRAASAPGEGATFTLSLPTAG